MTKEGIKQLINTFLIEELEIESGKLSDTSRIKEDVGIDSLDYVDIVAFISRNFRFKANLSAIKDIITLDELYEFICKNQEH